MPVPSTFGRGCTGGIRQPRSDCQRACDAAPDPTAEDLALCLEACAEELDGCLDACDAEFAEQSAEVSTANIPCYEPCNDCSNGCESGYNTAAAACLLAYPLCVAGCSDSESEGCVAACGVIAEACLAAAGSDAASCHEDCYATDRACSWACYASETTAINALKIARAECREACAPPESDHRDHRLAVCETARAECAVAAENDALSCFGAADILYPPEAGAVAAAECQTALDLVIYACDAARRECQGKAEWKWRRDSEQCDVRTVICVTACRAVYDEAWVECAAAADEAAVEECREEAATEQVKCQAQCCYDLYGFDEYTECYLACWRNPGSHETLEACAAEECDARATCSPCASFAFITIWPW